MTTFGAYRDALALSAEDNGPRLELALSLLAESKSVVLYEDSIALRRDGSRIYCEVVDPYAEGHETEEHFQQLITASQDLLASSSLNARLPTETLVWIVVRDYGTGTVQVWPKR